MSNTAYSLDVEERTKSGKSSARKARRNGQIPAILYSHGKDADSYLINMSDWDSISNKQVHIVKLKPSKDKSVNALIKDIQFDYLKGETVHIDFQEINMNEKIETSVIIHTVGTPKGLTEGGVLNHEIHEIEISCLPRDIPDEIEIDVSDLALFDSLSVADIKLPEGVEAILDSEEVILSVVEESMTLEEEESEEEEEEEEGLEGEEALEEGETAVGEAEEENQES